MKKVNLFYLCIFLMLFLISCWIDPNTETERIKVDNQTKEDVWIYYIDIFNFKTSHTTIRRDEERFVNFAPDITYYARGEKTEKEYGERTFVKLPSKIDIQRVWTIK